MEDLRIARYLNVAPADDPRKNATPWIPGRGLEWVNRIDDPKARNWVREAAKEMFPTDPKDLARQLLRHPEIPDQSLDNGTDVNDPNANTYTVYYALVLVVGMLIGGFLCVLFHIK